MPDDFTRISIFIPKSAQAQEPLHRLRKLAQKRDRSLNYMIVLNLLILVEVVAFQRWRLSNFDHFRNALYAMAETVQM
jgi:hypothetical protein